MYPDRPFLPKSLYVVLFLLLGVVYVTGLFVPLMDNDSAHHANIALRMYLTGDYVSLVDHGKDYLDKPHLHFWLSALGYNLFGVTTFAYKFPSFLFTLMGTYATYRLGRSLYNGETGRLAALIVASAFAYILANNDVRMDAILTASIVLATWQGVEWVQHKRIINALGLALGLALGFCTKGHIAVFTPGVGLLCYILYKRDWRSFYHPQLLLVIAAFAVFIAPVVYCYYLQYDLHPEKVIRGKSGRSGVAFILWKQNTERLQGDSFGADAKNDYLFFFHSFLWAFAPWSVLGLAAFFSRLGSFRTRRYEWLTLAVFAVLALLLSFSGFKLPHYLNIMFPMAAVLTASYLLERKERAKVLRRLLILQVVICALCLLAGAAVNGWAFPVRSVPVIISFLVLLGVSVYLFTRLKGRLPRLVALSAFTSILIFYLLNNNFYPQLLTWQGGNELADAARARVKPGSVYFWPGIYSSSYNFYTSELRKEWQPAAAQQPGPLWIMTDSGHLPELQQSGLRPLEIIGHRDHEITMLSLKFLNPQRRPDVAGRLLLVRVK